MPNSKAKYFKAKLREEIVQASIDDKHDCIECHEHKYGSVQKRHENMEMLRKFIKNYVQSKFFERNNVVQVAEGFCERKMPYGHVTRVDLCHQVLLQENLM